MTEITDYRSYLLTETEKRLAAGAMVLALLAIGLIYFKSPLPVLLLPLILKRGWSIYAE